MQKIPVYRRRFFENLDLATRHSAETILGIVGELLPQLDSAVDLGCGVGTWLAILEERGVEKIQGYDGEWVARDLLAIAPENFSAVDLREEIASETRYDLAISMEVAEHLPESSARTFVASCCRLSDFVLFSAAIPYQGGTGHLNEQWPSYWAALFAEQGYQAIDLIRPQIWNDELIPYWYRQNALLFVKQDSLGQLNGTITETGTDNLDLVHPELLIKKEEFRSELNAGWKHFATAIKNAIRGRRRPHRDAQCGQHHDSYKRQRAKLREAS